MKKNYCDEKPFHFFKHHSLDFLNRFLNILNKYNALILSMYNLEEVICFVHKFVLATLHYLLRCDLYSIYRLKLLNDICPLNSSGRKTFENFTLWSRRLHFPDEFWNFKVHNKVYLKKQIAFKFFYVFNVFMSNLCTKFTVSGTCLL